MSNARERLAPLTGPRNSVGRLIAGEKVVAAGATTDLNRGGAVNGNSTTASRSWTQGNNPRRAGQKPRGFFCSGSLEPPSEVTRPAEYAFGRAARGICAKCGREYALNDNGFIVRKHRRQR